MTEESAKLEGPDNNWLLISRGYYWRPGSKGYTAVRAEAGRYHKTEAAAAAVAGTTAIHESDAPMYAPAWTQVPTTYNEGSAMAELAMHLRAFTLGDRVEKISGACWRGKVVGFYSTALNPIGYAVESENEPGSVQIYPERALRKVEVING